MIDRSTLKSLIKLLLNSQFCQVCGARLGRVRYLHEGLGKVLCSDCGEDFDLSELYIRFDFRRNDGRNRIQGLLER